MKTPFTDKEQKIMDAITAAHILYCELPVQHQSDFPEWVESIHRLQQVIGLRVLRRDYPETFTNIETPKVIFRIEGKSLVNVLNNTHLNKLNKR